MPTIRPTTVFIPASPPRRRRRRRSRSGLRRKPLGWKKILAALVLVFNIIPVIVVTEYVIRPTRHRWAEQADSMKSEFEFGTRYKASPVELNARDGETLHGWWLLPPQTASRAVLFCHGLGESSAFLLDFARSFLDQGFAVLLPDLRGHGESPGVVTFGVREAQDIEQWVNWIKGRGIGSVFGLGESLGGAAILQSLQYGAGFRAVVADSPFSSFSEVADYQTAGFLGPVLAPVIVREAMVYMLFVHGANLWSANTVRAVVHTKVPILLIHAIDDPIVPPEQSLEIAGANPAIQTWFVLSVSHTGSYRFAKSEEEKRVFDWFNR